MSTFSSWSPFLSAKKQPLHRYCVFFNSVDYLTVSNDTCLSIVKFDTIFSDFCCTQKSVIVTSSNKTSFINLVPLFCFVKQDRIQADFHFHLPQDCDESLRIS